MSTNSSNLSSISYLPNGPTVYILRGVSGSGKSSVTRSIIQNLTLASSAVYTPLGGESNPEILSTLTVCSADNYFISPKDGVYRMDLTKLKDAHAWCEGQFALALETGVPIIIVDNTNTATWNYSKYEEMLLAYNFEMDAGLHPYPRSLTLPGTLTTSSSSSSGTTASSSASSSSSSTSSTTSTTSSAPTMEQRKDYELKIIEIDCPDAATLYLFNSRQVHGVPWETSIRQWTMFEHDPRGMKVSPYIDPVKDVPFIEHARTLSVVQSAQEVKNNPSSHPPLPPNRNNNNNNRNRNNYNNNINNSGNRSRASSTNSTNSNDSTSYRHKNNHYNGGHYQKTNYNNSSNNNTHTQRNTGISQMDTDGWQTVDRGNNKHTFFGAATSTTSTVASSIVASSSTNMGVRSIVELAPKVIQRINYLAFFLKQESTDLLLNYFSIPEQFTARYGHHVTIAFLPTMEECTPALMACFGCDVQLQVYAFAIDKRIMACAVRWPRKTVPYGTVTDSSSNSNENAEDDGENVMDDDNNDDDNNDHTKDNDTDNDDDSDKDANDQNERENEKPVTFKEDTNEGNSIDIVDSSIGSPDKNGYYNGILENRLSHIGPNGMVRRNIPHISIASLPRTSPQKSNELLEKKRLHRVKPFPIVARFGAKVAVPGGYHVITNPQTWNLWYADKYNELYK